MNPVPESENDYSALFQAIKVAKTNVSLDQALDDAALYSEEVEELRDIVAQLEESESCQTVYTA